MNTILITPRAFTRYGAHHIDRMQEMGYKVIAKYDGTAFTREEFVDHALTASGVIIGTEPMGKELLEKCKNLKAIVRYGVGTDNVDLETVDRLGIGFDRCAGSNSVTVAEMAVSFMFTMARGLPEATRNVREGRWEKVDGIELLGKTIGIIGFGDIGRQVARICGGIGMKVIACASKPIKSELLKEYSAEDVSLDEICERSDVISVNVPLNDSTRNMISTPEFTKMKDRVIIVNTARGGIINDRAALDALKSRKIGSYATDVFLPEPVVYEPWVKELLDLPNFILTPHMASRTEEADRNMTNMSAEKLIRLLS